MTDLTGFTASSGPLAITLNGNFQSIGAIGIYTWSPGQGNQWTVVHKDTQWAPSSGPHAIPPLAPGSKLLWIAGLATTANPPAPVAATVVVAAGGNPLDVTPVTGIATATTAVQQQKMYNL